MATKVGKHLFSLSNNKHVIASTLKFGVVAYAVIVKLDEYSQLSDDGKIPNALMITNKIALELNTDAVKVSDVVQYLKDKEFLLHDIESMWVHEWVKDVKKANDISEKRSKASANRENPGRKKTPSNLSEEQKQLYDQYIQIINKEFSRAYKGDETSKRKFKACVSKGYVIQDFEKAIKNAKKNEYHQKNNYNYLTPSFFCREDKLLMYLHAKTNTEGSSSGFKFQTPSLND